MKFFNKTFANQDRQSYNRHNNHFSHFGNIIDEKT